MDASAEAAQAGWARTWESISSGENLRWKASEAQRDFELHFALLEGAGAFSSRNDNAAAATAATAADSGAGNPSAESNSSSVFVPMSGDCPFAAYALERGKSVTCVEWVPEAVERLKASVWRAKKFDGDGSSASEADELSVAHAADMRVFQGDIFAERPSEFARHTVLYDRHAFGAIQPGQRKNYVSLMSRYLRPGSIVLLDGMRRSTNVDDGPPFHVPRDLIDDVWVAHGGFEVLEEHEGLVDLSPSPFKTITYLLRWPGPAASLPTAVKSGRQHEEPQANADSFSSSTSSWSVTRLYSDGKGDTHFEEVLVPLTSRGIIGDISDTVAVADFSLRETPATYNWGFHNAPARQYIIMLSGVTEVETSLGEKRMFRAGDVMLVEDVSGKGHKSRSVDGTVRRSIFVTLADQSTERASSL